MPCGATPEARPVVNILATTNPAAGLARPSKGEAEQPEGDPTENDLHAALDAEERDDPEQ